MNLEKLRQIALQDCQLSPALPVLVGVSGGPDSLCLLDSLVRLDFKVVAAHFDHQLRETSAQDAHSVQVFASSLGIPFVAASGDVAGTARAARLSIETAARQLRYRFLFAQAYQHGAQAVAVGHNADDQVETVLMHLLRGAGLAGLSGMPYRAHLPIWSQTIPLVRPLLHIWREEILDYCQERGLRPVMDASNQDLAFSRNRLRHELIPFLETYNPRVRTALWRMSQSLAGDETVVQQAVQTAWEACQPEVQNSTVQLRLAAFRTMPAGLQRGVLRRAVEVLQSTPLDLDYAAVQRGLEFLQSPTQTARLIW
jgi:tRNA(Ile)-lysidine synthase